MTCLRALCRLAYPLLLPSRDGGWEDLSFSSLGPGDPVLCPLPLCRAEHSSPKAMPKSLSSRLCLSLGPPASVNTRPRVLAHQAHGNRVLQAGCLNSGDGLSHSSGGPECKIKVMADVVSSKAPALGLWVPPCPRAAFPGR